MVSVSPSDPASGLEAGLGIGFSDPALPELILELPLELPTEADSCGFLQSAEGFGCAAGTGLEAPVLKVLTVPDECQSGTDMIHGTVAAGVRHVAYVKAERGPSCPSDGACLQIA